MAQNYQVVFEGYETKVLTEQEAAETEHTGGGSWINKGFFKLVTLDTVYLEPGATGSKSLKATVRGKTEDGENFEAVIGWIKKKDGSRNEKVANRFDAMCILLGVTINGNSPTAPLEIKKYGEDRTFTSFTDFKGKQLYMKTKETFRLGNDGNLYSDLYYVDGCDAETKQSLSEKNRNLTTGTAFKRHSNTNFDTFIGIEADDEAQREQIKAMVASRRAMEAAEAAGGQTPAPVETAGAQTVPTAQAGTAGNSQVTVNEQDGEDVF